MPISISEMALFGTSTTIRRSSRIQRFVQVLINYLNLLNYNCRKILALALIPREQVRRGFYLIVANSPPGLEAFLAYFARTYIGMTVIEQHDGALAFLPPPPPVRPTLNFGNLKSLPVLIINLRFNRVN
jgi:hypothetical protein